MPHKDKKKSAAYIRKWRRANPDRVRGYSREYETSGKRDMTAKLKTNAAYKARNRALVAEMQKAYYRAHGSEARAYGTVWRRKISLSARLHLGGECRCCGEKEMEMLVIDHIHNDGFKAAKTTQGNRNAYVYYRKVYDAFENSDEKAIAEVKKKYQVLCYNCNASKRNGGSCIHGRGNPLTHPEFPYRTLTSTGTCG